MRPCQRGSLLDHIFQPFGVSRSTWDVEKEADDLLRLLFGVPHDSGKTDSQEDAKPENAGPQASTEGTGEAGEATGDSEASPEPKEGEEEEVKSKTGGNTESGHESTPQQPAGQESGPKCPAGHCYHAKSIGLWEPLLLGGLFGPTRVLGAGPVGYRITWRGPRSCCSSTVGAACA